MNVLVLRWLSEILDWILNQRSFLISLSFRASAEMGLTTSTDLSRILCSRFVRKRDVQIAMCNRNSQIQSRNDQITNLIPVGLNGPGKTTILYKLKLDQVLTTIPTVGFNIESIDYKNLRFNIWDIGGGSAIRSLWGVYASKSDAAIFVVDSNDRGNIAEAIEEIQNKLNMDAFENIPVLVFANKQDLPDAMSADDLAEKLRLNAMLNLTVSSSSNHFESHDIWHLSVLVAYSSMFSCHRRGT